MKRCQFCSLQVSEDAKFCTHCGKGLPQGQASQVVRSPAHNFLLAVIAGLLVILVIQNFYRSGAL